MSDNLQDTFSSLGDPSGPNYSHPQHVEIIRDAVALLETIPTGKALLPLIKLNDIKIRVIIGKEPSYFTPDNQTVLLVSPKNTASVNPFEVSCNLGMALKETTFIKIQGLNPDLASLRKKIIDIVIEMCKIVSEFEDVHKHRKLVDLVEKLGHSEVYKSYRSNADYKELADIISKSVNFEGRVK